MIPACARPLIILDNRLSHAFHWDSVNNAISLWCPPSQRQSFRTEHNKICTKYRWADNAIQIARQMQNLQIFPWGDPLFLTCALKVSKLSYNVTSETDNSELKPNIPCLGIFMSVHLGTWREICIDYLPHKHNKLD